MTKLHHEVKINAPLERAWGVLANLEAVQHYNPGVATARYISPNREGVGAARECNFKMGGSVKERVIEWEPMRMITIELSEHPWPVKSAKWRTVLKFDGNETLMLQDTEYEYAGDPQGSEAMQAQWDQAISAVTQSFKRYVEAGATWP
jgi:ligand-binding SRPBCC domain-containing protein